MTALRQSKGTNPTMACVLQFEGAMPCVKVAPCLFFLTGLLLSRSAAAEHVKPVHSSSAEVHTQGKPLSTSALRLAVRPMGFNSMTFVNGPSIFPRYPDSPPSVTLCGAAAGVIVLDRAWFEVSYLYLIGRKFAQGSEKALKFGYLVKGTFQPNAWQISFPSYLMLASLNRPAEWGDDIAGYEPLITMGVGGRAVLTRNFDANAFEIGASLEFSVPIHRSAPVGDTQGYTQGYDDPRTRWLFTPGLILGWQFGL